MKDEYSYWGLIAIIVSLIFVDLIIDLAHYLGG